MTNRSLLFAAIAAIALVSSTGITEARPFIRFYGPPVAVCVGLGCPPVYPYGYYPQPYYIGPAPNTMPALPQAPMPPQSGRYEVQACSLDGGRHTVQIESSSPDNHPCN